MCTIPTLKWKCRLDIESTIDTPPTSFFVKNETSARLCYIINGQYKYIYLPTKLDVAELLKKNHLIQFYSCQGESVKMFEKVLITITGDKGQPIQQQRLVEVKWADVDLTDAQVHGIAAAHELENNKVVKALISKIFKAA